MSEVKSNHESMQTFYDIGLRIELPGECPECGKHDDVLVNIGIAQWRMCSAHKKCWIAGYNIDDSWRGQTTAQQELIYDHYKFGDLDHVHENIKDRLACVAKKMRRDATRLVNAANDRGDYRLINTKRRRTARAVAR